MTPSGHVGKFSERDLAFWTQFAQLWKHLAGMSNDAQRSEYLKKAENCLLKVEAIRAELDARLPLKLPCVTPFPPQSPQPFTQASVESITPGQIGCYGVFRYALSGIECLYVGKGVIRERLLEHLSGENSCIIMSGPTHWMAAITPDCDELEKQLILELAPKCNRRVA
jgi:hypothetical protein